MRPAIDAFKFTEKAAESSREETEILDSDGYILVSDKDLCGFEFYLPKECEVISSSIAVNAKFSDKANINITKAASTGVGILDYLKTRKTQLEALFGDVTDISLELEKLPTLTETNKDIFKDFDVEPTANPDIKFGDLGKSQTIVYEYSYVHLGVTYRVYQILGVKPGFLGIFGGAGYVLTYTATVDEYENHIDTVKTILNKVTFE